jgi:3',5'-cyclic AMP phosphodiesterase CpdA
MKFRRFFFIFHIFSIFILAGTLYAKEPTTSTSTPQLTFGVIADVQYADAESRGTRYYRKSLKKFEDCVRDFNSHKPVFVVQLGDIVDHDSTSFEPTLAIYKKLNMPAYHVIGNHDASTAFTANKTPAEYLGIKKGYYDFVYSGWRFVVLDATELNLFITPASNPAYVQAKAMYEELRKKGASNAQPWNGGVSNDQLVWFKNILAKAAKAQEKVIVFGHNPIWPQGSHNLWNDHEVFNIIEKSGCVVAYMNGHNHQGSYHHKNGIHYLNFQGMIETADTTAYALVKIYPDRLEVVGYGREPSRTLTFVNRESPESGLPLSNETKTGSLDKDIGNNAMKSK